MEPAAGESPTPDSPDVGALFSDEHRRVLAFVARRVSDRATAEDIAGETFLIALKRIEDGVRVDCPWLFVTARNLVANHNRRVAVRARQLAVDGMAPRDAIRAEDVSDRVRDVLDGLRSDQQAVLRLRYWDEMSARETAAVLGCSESAVWVRLHRARSAFAAAWRSADGKPGSGAAASRLTTGRL